jgi:preprotein translocase subunit SecA
MLGFLQKIFKTKKDRDVETLRPIVGQIAAQYQHVQQLNDDELRQQTAILQQKVRDYVSAIVQAIDELQSQINQEIQDRNIGALAQRFEELDKLKTQRNEALSEILEEIAPTAFAVVKETCRRLTHNKELRVTATDYDRATAARKSHVVIEGDTAVWHNKWLAAGNEVEWNMVHYDVQLMGGHVLHSGKIAEMATGEGKTLVSTLPAYLNALAGVGVHIVTVNDYLARRDSEWNGPIYEFHGLTVDCIDNHKPNSEERRRAYQANITYGTNNEFGFDYLRDNMVTHPEHLVQREHFFAIIDEVDSVLVDEARTPLIISGPVMQASDDEKQFKELKPHIERLVKQQSQVTLQCLVKAKSLLQPGATKEAEREGGMLLFRAYRGLPKNKPLIKFLSESGMRQLLTKTEAYYLQDHQKHMHLIDAELYFTIDEKNQQIELTEKGRDLLAGFNDDPDFFLLPDMATAVAEIEHQVYLSAEEKRAQKEALVTQYAIKSELLHSVNQMLRAYTLFEKDVDYIVSEDKVLIVDENTGRVMQGRRYSDGLHQALESKENVKVEESTQTYATITLQNYFRMYYKLAGMTGTAETEAGEFYEIYKLDVVVVPTNTDVIRKDVEDLVYKTQREKYNAIIEEIARLSAAGRPVLVGTSSVEVSELLGKMLSLRKVTHNILNAKQHQKEATIVAEAGQAGIVTIATNMAGRGTDIKLGPGVREAGGLAIVGTERHDSRRIDRQLRGRAGRQGDPGTSQFFVSLEDNLMRMFGSERIARVMDTLKMKEGEVIQHSLITKSITNAQKKVEENNFGIRKRLLEYDDVMNKQREVIYRRRRNALFGDRIKLDLDNMVSDFCHALADKYHEESQYERLNLDCLKFLGIDPAFDNHTFDRLSTDKVAQQVYDQAIDHYRTRETNIGPQFAEHLVNLKTHQPQFQFVQVEFTDGKHVMGLVLDIQKVIDTQGAEMFNEFEKAAVLSTIDDLWKQHLREMDDLKQSVQTATIEQKDPLLIYKLEAFELFQRLLNEINEQVLSLLFKSTIVQEQEQQKPIPVKRDDFSKLNAKHEAVQTPTGVGADDYFEPYGEEVDYEDDEVGGGNPSSSRPGAPQAPLSRRDRREQERKSKKTKNKVV